jgi:uncharacterized membrane protein
MRDTSALGPSWDPKDDLQVQRLEALSDGIFAIVMTILVFDLKAFSGPVDQLPSALFQLWPNFLGYTISFSLLGIYWLGQLSQFKYIRKSDHNFVWINILFFACVALVPFTTASLSRFPFAIVTLALYAANLILIGIVLYLIWRYATTGYRLIDKETPRFVIKYGALRCLVAPAGYILALGFAVISPVITLLLFVIIPLIYILPCFHAYWILLAKGMVKGS